MAFDLGRLLELLQEGGHPGPIRRSGRRLLFVCPACGKKALKLGVTSGWWQCFYCREANGTAGPAHRLLALALNMPDRAAAAALYGDEVIAPLEVSENLFYEEDDDEEILPERVCWDYHHHPIADPQAERGAAYLEGRGIPMDVAVQYGIRYSPVDRRVLFPVEMEGRLVGWQGRLVIPNEWRDDQGELKTAPKVLSSRNIPRDRCLMFQDRVVGHDAVLCEGPIDALKAHLVGGNVASMGKTVSDGQLDVLRKKKVRRVYLALDPDAAEDVGGLARRLQGLEVRLVEVPHPYKDLGQMSLKDAAETVRAAEVVLPWHFFVYFGGPAA